MLMTRMEPGLRAAIRWAFIWPTSHRWPLNPSGQWHCQLSGVRAWQVPLLRQAEGPHGEGTQRWWPDVSSVTVTCPPGHLGEDREQVCSFNCVLSMCKIVCVRVRECLYVFKCVWSHPHTPALVFPPQVHTVEGAAAGLGTAGVWVTTWSHPPPLQHRAELGTLTIQKEGVVVQPHIPQAACERERET